MNKRKGKKSYEQKKRGKRENEKSGKKSKRKKV
jgi:hypothetical protein